MIASRGRSGEAGFALIAAIWFVALMALVAVIIAGWMTRSLGLATRLQDRLAAHTAVIDAQNEVEYRLVTGFLSARGLEMPQGDELTAASAPEASFGYQFTAATRYVALDNRPYRLGSATARLQDDRGLYSLNHPDVATLGALLGHYGVDDNDRNVLIDRLLDYMDKSGLHRINGATAEDYKAAGRPPPRGAPLLSPWETLRVLSWDGYSALWRGPQALPDVTTTGNVVQLNPNTAPEAILASLPGMDDAAAQRVVAYRQRYVIQDLGDLDDAAGVAVGVDPMSLMFFPSDSIEATLAAPDDPLVHRLRLQLTPNAKAPFRIDYVVGLPTDRDSRAVAAKLAQLPEIPSYSPNRPGDAGDTSAGQ